MIAKLTITRLIHFRKIIGLYPANRRPCILCSTMPKNYQEKKKNSFIFVVRIFFIKKVKERFKVSVKLKV